MFLPSDGIIIWVSAIIRKNSRTVISSFLKLSEHKLIFSSRRWSSKRFFFFSWFVIVLKWIWYKSVDLIQSNSRKFWMNIKIFGALGNVLWIVEFSASTCDVVRRLRSATEMLFLSFWTIWLENISIIHPLI